MQLSIIIVHYRDPDRLMTLLDSLPAALGGLGAQVVVVDNESRDAGLELRLRDAWPDSVFLANRDNLGFAAGVNQGVRASRGDVLAILNPDVRLEQGFFAPLLALLARDARIGVVGPSVFRPDGRRQHTAHRRFPNLLTVFVEYCLPLHYVLSRWLPCWHPHAEDGRRHRCTHRTAHLAGVCMLTRRQTFLESGGLDERFFLYLEETDWQLRLARRGLQVWYCAESRLTHDSFLGKRYAGAMLIYLESLFRYWEKWFGRGSLPALRVAIGLAALSSLAGLCLLYVPALARPPLGRKVQAHVRAFLVIARWLARRRQLA